MAPNKSLLLTPELQRYLVEHSIAPLPEHDAIAAVTVAETGDAALMQVPPEQGALLTWLVRLVDARLAVEVGTFTGFSALSIALGLRPGGRLVCCDIEARWPALGAPFWRSAGVADRIDVRIGPATETLAQLAPDPPVDFAFVDADKPGYLSYYELLLERLRPGGVMVFDNVLWGGAVVDPSATDDQTESLRRFNDTVAADDRVDASMINVADGLLLVRKR